MVIKGTAHLAEVVKLQDLKLHDQTFRYSVQREGSGHIIYWGHEASEDAAVQMAKKYLELMDRSLEARTAKPSAPPESVGFQEPLAEA